MSGYWVQWTLGLLLLVSSAHAQDETDTDEDGLPDALEFAGDTDGDGTPNASDSDDDGDGVPTSQESVDADLDGDGKLDYLDDDDDGDGVSTLLELGPGGSANPLNTDGDWFPNLALRPDYLDSDDDGDNVPTKDEVASAGASPTAFDLDDDKIANYLDDDDDGDSALTYQEVDFDGDPLNPEAYDSDGDKTPNYLDTDDDGDGIPSLLEDRDHNGTPLNDDLKANGEDADGIPGFLDPDDDDDRIPTLYELGPAGIAAPRNSDSDDVPDYLDADDDNDGIPTYSERSVRKQPDVNGNKIPDYLDKDADGSKAAPLPSGGDDFDGDGVFNRDETANPEEDYDTADADDDGTPNMQDQDDDGDRVDTYYEYISAAHVQDTDKDGKQDFLDPDDDGDTIPTSEEDPDPDGDGNPADARETIPGIKDYLSADDDGDGIPTADELGAGGPDNPVDSDGNGTPDYRDPPSMSSGDGGVAGDGDGEGDGDGDTSGDGDTGGDGNPGGDGDGSPDGGAPGPGAGKDGGEIGGSPSSSPGSHGCSAHPGAGRSGFAWLFVALLFLLARATARQRLSQLGALLFVWCLGGCGDDAPVRESETLGGLDGGRPTKDAGRRSETDAETDADAAVDTDASVDPQQQCEVDPVEFSLQIDDTGSSPWDLKLFEDTFELVYQVTTCAPPGGGNFQGLRHLSFQSTGAFGEPQDLINMSDDDCTYSRSPVLGVNAAGKPVVYYGAEGSELARLEVGSTKPQRFTMDDDATNDEEDLVAWARFDQSELLAYVNSIRVYPDPAYGQLVTRQAGQSERPLIERSAQHHFSSLALTPFATAGAGGALAWVYDGSTAAIQLQLLDSSGAAKGTPLMLSQGVGTGTNAALATRRSDQLDLGAVVFSEAPLGATNQRVVFRSFDPQGTLGAAVRIVSGDRDARDVGIASFADGYVVAFRLLSGTGRPNPVIQLAFVNTMGRGPAGGGERTLTDASSSGGAVKVLTAPDGRLVVGFTDRTDAGLFLHVLRANCLQ